MSDKIPTAEEYLASKGMSNVGHYGLLITDPSKQYMHQIMEDYANIKAQFHVEAALKAASEKAEGYTIGKESGKDVIIDKRTIINAYTKENII